MINASKTKGTQKTKDGKIGIGLGLSGGGYRAAAFHLGVLEAFNEIRVKNRDGKNGPKNASGKTKSGKTPPRRFIDLIQNFSAVSGGAIIGTYYILKGKGKDFKQFKNEFIKEVLSANCERDTILYSEIIFWPMLLSLVSFFSFPFFFNALGAHSHWLKLISVTAGFGVAPILIAVLRFTEKPLQTAFAIIITALLSGSFIFADGAAWFRFAWPYATLGIIAYPACFILLNELYPSFSKKKAKFLNKVFEDKRLHELPEEPKLAINATTFETGESWIFSHSYFGGSKSEQDNVEFIAMEQYPIGDAVSASSNFPPVYEPNRLHKRHLNGHKATYSFTDGGSIDNHGIARLSSVLNGHQKGYYNFLSDIVLISDAETPWQMIRPRKNMVSQISYLITRVLLSRVGEINQYLFGKRSENLLLPGAIYIRLSYSIDSIIRKEFSNEHNRQTVARRLGELRKKIKPHEFDFDEGMFLDSNHNYPLPGDPVYATFKKRLFNAIGFFNNDALLSNEDLAQIHKLNTGLSPFKPGILTKLIDHGKAVGEFLVKFWLLDYDETDGSFLFREGLFEAIQDKKQSEKREKAEKSQDFFEYQFKGYDKPKRARDAIDEDKDLPDFLKDF